MVEAFDLAGIRKTEGAPSFRVLCERVGCTDVYLNPNPQESRSEVSHPCKRRKDGAPSIEMMHGEIKARQPANNRKKNLGREARESPRGLSGLPSSPLLRVFLSLKFVSSFISKNRHRQHRQKCRPQGALPRQLHQFRTLRLPTHAPQNLRRLDPRRPSSRHRRQRPTSQETTTSQGIMCQEIAMLSEMGIRLPRLQSLQTASPFPAEM